MFVPAAAREREREREGAQKQKPTDDDDDNVDDVDDDVGVCLQSVCSQEFAFFLQSKMVNQRGRTRSGRKGSRRGGREI